MPDKIDRQIEPVVNANNTLGIGDLSTQPSSIEKSAGAQLPIEFGRYRLLKQLGEGGMGVVYLAHDIELDRKVALKLPHFSGAKSKELAERFRREAKLAATLDHPNICRIYDIGEHQGRLFLTMAFVEGRSLHEIIRAKGAIEPRAAVTLLKRIAGAVQFAHAQGIIHRDLKPANIMIKKDRDFVIMDFGLARRVDQEEAQLTAPGTVLGTPAYMAPEQLRGEKGASGPQSDVYSLGIILFELLTGQRPFQGSLAQIYAQVLSTDLVSPSSVLVGMAPALDAVCQKATNKDSSLRYQSAEEFALALNSYLIESNSVGLVQERVSPQQPNYEYLTQGRATKPPRRRKPTQLVALGAAGFFTILMAAIVILIRNKDGTTTELKLPDGAQAVEVQRDNRTIATLDVSGESITVDTASSNRGQQSTDNEQLSKSPSRRDVAMWLLENGGEIYPIGGGVFRTKEELPKSEFEMDGIVFPAITSMPGEYGPGFRSFGIRSLSLSAACPPSLFAEVLSFAMPSVTQLDLKGDISTEHLKGMQPSNVLTKLTFTGVSVPNSLGEFKRFASYPQLKELWINAAHGFPLELLGDFPQLEKLVLWGCGASDAHLQYLGQMPHLREIQLGANWGIKGSGLEFLQGLQRLESLSVYGSGVEGQFLEKISELETLKILSIGKIKIGDGDLAFLPSLQSLHRLEIKETGITDLSGPVIAQLESLSTLVVSQTSVTDKFLDSIAACKSLRSLDVTGTQITDLGVARFSKTNPDCRVQK